MFRKATHELHALEKWVKDMLEEDIMAPESKTEAARGKRSDLEKRAQLCRSCVQPLVDQIECYSSNLAELVSQVFERHHMVIEDSLKSYDKQLAATKKIAWETKKLVNFSERHMNRLKNKSELSLKRSDESKSDLNNHRISLRLLQTEHIELIKTSSQYSEILASLARAAEEESSLQTTTTAFDQLDITLKEVESERLKALNVFDDMDGLVNQLELEYLQDKQAEIDRKFASISCQTDIIEEVEPHVAEETKDVEEAGEIVPKHKPKEWRRGWHIPYNLRVLMTSFKESPRIMDEMKLHSLIYSVLWSRLKVEKDPNPKAVVKSRKKQTVKEAPKCIYSSLYDHFVKSYGIQEMVDWHVGEFINSLIYYHSSKRVRMMSYLLGVTKSLEGSTAEQDTKASSGENDYHLYLIDVLEQVEKANIFTDKSKDVSGVIPIRRSVVMKISERIFDKHDMQADLLSEIDTIPNISNEEWETPEVDLDAYLYEMLLCYESHKESMFKCLKHLFLEHATIFKNTSGVLIECGSLDPEDKSRIFEKSVNSRSGKYMAFLRQPGLNKILISKLKLSLNKRQVAALFVAASDFMKGHREFLSQIFWLEQSVESPSGFTRLYFVNQLSNDRVWDLRPDFLSAIEERYSARQGEEIDLETFISVAFKNQWKVKL